MVFKDVTAPTNVRSMIATLIPGYGVGNTLPVILTEEGVAFLLLANFNAVVFDYVARQKVQGQHLNKYIVEQLPVVPPDQYEAVCFGSRTAGEIIREAVLELTYTAHDMAPFARDTGYVDGEGIVKPPFRWDAGRRLQLRAKLDAVFFCLYGITDRADIRYIYSTFPIVPASGGGGLRKLSFPGFVSFMDECPGGGSTGCGHSVDAEGYDHEEATGAVRRRIRGKRIV